MAQRLTQCAAVPLLRLRGILVLAVAPTRIDRTIAMKPADGRRLDRMRMMRLGRLVDRALALALAPALAMAWGLALGVGGAPAFAAEPTSALARLSAADRAFLGRITWGPDEASAAALLSLGRQGFIDRQLHPSPAGDLPPAVADRIAAMDLGPEATLAAVRDLNARRQRIRDTADLEERQQARRDLVLARRQAGAQATGRALLRAAYSKNQLHEQMTWFWMNHFSVAMQKGDIGFIFGDYEDAAVRANALGRFRDILGAAAAHPVMLQYLDNDRNRAGRLNENYARELMELHTLGVDGGYAQADVEALARVLTGLGVSRTGEPDLSRAALRRGYVLDGVFEFNPRAHDYGDKVFLGQTIRGEGLGEFERVLDILAAHPSTATFVSRRLAAFFVADDPPPELVARMAARFTATDGDIAQVLRLLFAAPEFEASLGGRFKDPTRFLLSAVRLSYSRPVPDEAALARGLIQLSQPLYRRATPDGYPLATAEWASGAQMLSRFEVARQIAGGAVAGPIDPLAVGLETWLSGASRDAVVDAATARERLALFLSSPDFMRY
jgi:uncharacterized protein (DUF1800 family)